MNRYVRKTLKILLWITGIVLLLIALQIAALAFPQPWFNHSVRDGNLTIYSDDPVDPGMESMFRGVRDRLEVAELYDESTNMRVFVCNNQGLYSVFARLALVPTHVPGFNLSLFNNTFVSITRLNERRYSNRAGIKHSALAGDLEQSITHELIHDYTQERIGFFVYRKLPRWKTEGYAEYESVKLVLGRDTDETLVDRIHTMQSAFNSSRAREYYGWTLVVEYLSSVKGYTFEQIHSPDVTLDDATAQMMVWYNEQLSSSSANYY